ncbi:TRAP transporter large permease [Seohaeicola zhoushanensis]|uniref:TRAP transporter large permease protein n=1 Tax=Seohaeicola zhoushanensis TaxID=1569283 RepID=A0A8J3H1W6_9RHOB|nr:TRAP transporter large permease subunit [Seohaeicola zhoushanensis]GHF65088.1 tripartite transporter large subunit [Seohaeicola zhoushanensis]
MVDPLLPTILLFGGMFLLLGLGVPIAFSLGGLSVGMIYFFWSPAALTMIPLRAYATATSFEYLSIPMFIFMAAMLQKSRIADDLYDAMQKFMGGIRGGLAIGTILICTMFSAMAGISGAATIAMGMVAIPAMLSRGYNRQMTLGSIAAGGSLGILIPPSVTMIVYGLVAGTSIGGLYMGGILPGLLLAFLFALYAYFRSVFDPAVQADPVTYSWGERLRSLRKVVLPIGLAVAVMGSILTGTAAVAEASAVGAGGAVLAAAIARRLTFQNLTAALRETMVLSTVIFWIIIASSALSTFYSAIGATRMIEGLIMGLEVNRWVIIIIMLLILMVLGMVLETTGIIMITAPIFAPIAVNLGFDPVWFGVLFIVLMEMGFLTPPFGYNLFYLKGVAPKDVTMNELYLSIIPFVAIMILGVGLMLLFPQIILWLPKAIM